MGEFPAPELKPPALQDKPVIVNISELVQVVVDTHVSYLETRKECGDPLSARCAPTGAGHPPAPGPQRLESRG